MTSGDIRTDAWISGLLSRATTVEAFGRSDMDVVCQAFVAKADEVSGGRRVLLGEYFPCLPGTRKQRSTG